jgi:hypothetical protein
MSVDYVVRLEQGRSSQPSTQLLGALARALRLNEDERAHLFHLAGHQPPPAEGAAGMARLGLVRVIDLLIDTPALVLSELGEVLVQNHAATLLMGDLTACTGDERFIVYRWFTDPTVRGEQPIDEQERQSRSLVADLRAVAGRRPDDKKVIGLIERLRAASRDFRRLWSAHEVGVRRADRKTFVHPRVGPILMDCETLVTPDLGQELLVLTPANREASERLALLYVLGTEEFASSAVQVDELR